MTDETSNPMREQIQAAIDDNPVILFMKGTPDQPMCGFSARTVAILQSVGRAAAGSRAGCRRAGPGGPRAAGPGARAAHHREPAIGTDSAGGAASPA